MKKLINKTVGFIKHPIKTIKNLLWERNARKKAEKIWGKSFTKEDMDRPMTQAECDQMADYIVANFLGGIDPATT